MGDTLDTNELALLSHIPAGCDRALDVGCGAGAFARELAVRVQFVDAIDRSSEMIAVARRRWAGLPNLRFVEGDFMEMDLPAQQYAFISCISVLHHMPFEAALEKLRDALAPGGVLAVLGLHRNATVTDYAVSAVSVAARRFGAIGRMFASPVPPKGDSRVIPPLAAPEMTLDEIRAGAERVLPGARVERHLGFRYSLRFERS